MTYPRGAHLSHDTFYTPTKPPPRHNNRHPHDPLHGPVVLADDEMIIHTLVMDA